MRFIPISLFVLLMAGISFSAEAQNSADIDPVFCRNLVKHIPRADVTYQPGIDVNGKPVAPADLPGSQQIQMPSKIYIPLTINLARRINFDASKYPSHAHGDELEGVLGVLTVEDNQVLFNGKPLGDAEQDNLAVLCMKQTGSKP